MICPACNGNSPFEDGFCSACGVEVPESRLPVKGESNLPTAWRQAAPVVARGAALVLAGIAAEWLLRTAAKGAVESSGIRRTRPSKKPQAVAHNDVVLFEEIVAVSRTVITRRVVSRR